MTDALERTAPIPYVRRAPLAPRCAPLGLLDEPWAFSQQSLLTAHQFAAAAKNRRISLPGDHEIDERALEELHRTGLLVPLFSVDRSYEPRSRLWDEEAAARGEPRSSSTAYLLDAHAAGAVADTAEQTFTPWPEANREIYYSPHQLLGLTGVTRFLATLERFVDASWTAHWHLPDDSRPKTSDLEAAASWRLFATALTYLDSAYRPQVTRQLRGALPAWRSYQDGHDARAALGRFGGELNGENIYQAVMGLRLDAAHVDDLGDFYDLVRRSGGESWDSLRGGARIAMDFRIGAEMLELCATDAGFAMPEMPRYLVPLHQQGLHYRERSLDAALTRLHLSPHPSVVLAVEGETEELLVPRVAELLGIDLAREWITLDCFGGADKDLTPLARYAAAPVPGRDIGNAVVLDRPLTRFLVLVDAEKKFKTEAMRERQRVSFLNEIAKQLPPDLRPDIRDPTGVHVEIRTWGPLPFEFEHFDDDELADGLETAAGTPHPLHSRAALIEAMRLERARREPNVEHAWEGEGPNKVTDGPKKVQIADALWPKLQEKITQALETGQPGPPIMQGVRRAIELALMSPRSNVALRRHQPT